MQAYRQDLVYLFLSEDGVYRQRCGTHLSFNFKGVRPIAVLKSEPATLKRSCVQCYWEKRSPKQFQQENSDEYAE